MTELTEARRALASYRDPSSKPNPARLAAALETALSVASAVESLRDALRSVQRVSVSAGSRRTVQGEPATPISAPPLYLAADVWDAVGAPTTDFDAYYERNGWAGTWANVLGTVRDRFRPKCGQLTAGERCVLTVGHLPPHYGPSDVGRSEPVPAAQLQGEPSDGQERLDQIVSLINAVDDGGEPPTLREIYLVALGRA